MATDLTTANVIDTKSGTGWTITVTACNLLPDLSIKDFIVLIDSVLEPNANITKTSQTVLTYTGASISSSTVEVRRVTPNDRFQEITFAERLSSTVYNEEIDRAIRRGYEATLNGIGPGSTVTTVAPTNDAYPAGWSTDTVRSRTANRLFEEFEKRGTLSENEAVTGDWTAPTQTDADGSTKLATTAYSDTRVTNALTGSPALGGNPTAPTQADGNNSTRIANTAFVHNFPIWREVGQLVGDGVASSEVLDLTSLGTEPTRLRLEWEVAAWTTNPHLALLPNEIATDAADATTNAFFVVDGTGTLNEGYLTGGAADTFLTISNSPGVNVTGMMGTAELYFNASDDRVYASSDVIKSVTGGRFRVLWNSVSTAIFTADTGFTSIELRSYQAGTTTLQAFPTSFICRVYARTD